MYRFFTVILFFIGLGTPSLTLGQVDYVNVFLGSSGDHGQVSPAASSPFRQLSILPHTYPSTHTGYEFLAKDILGFTHNRMEGVGCQGAGGLLLVRPFVGESDPGGRLTKRTESAGPGFYEIGLSEGIQANVAVDGDYGVHEYQFPAGPKGLVFDFAHSFNNAFVDNEYVLDGETIVGKVRSKTTCHAGIYTIYYAIRLSEAVRWEPDGQVLTAFMDSSPDKVTLRIAFSAVETRYAQARLAENEHMGYDEVKSKSRQTWEAYLSKVSVEGDEARKGLFYSLLYRTLQSPFLTSEPDGHYRGTDGEIHAAQGKRYHGWAIWDNYKTQLPLIDLAYPEVYKDMVLSISDLYRYGKYDFAGPYEPANTVRTEHAAVVLLDAQRKGYDIQFHAIRDSLIRDTARFDFSRPDKYLEASYDMWVMSQLFDGGEAAHYLARARSYTSVWEKEFKDLTRSDVDRMSARGMYQGTIRQYRWNVPFDVQGLVRLAGGKDAFTEQVDDFFDNHYFNRANEPDLQSPTMYYATAKPWRYQSLVHELALDTVIQFYFNDNSRGIGAHIDRIYKNEPKALIRTMDDDAGAMSAWFVLTALGLHQPLIGEPIYYLNVPLFPEIKLDNGGKPLTIRTRDFADENHYIARVTLNGKDLGRVWLRKEELAEGGLLEIHASRQPTSYGMDSIWVSSMD